MCQSPSMLAGGQLVACHKCPQCIDLARNDWAGRCIAEQKSSDAAYLVTLTYGRNKANDIQHERSVLLTYRDVKLYLKLLRRHGYNVRYFVAGEYGGKKGRAHWHIMLYFRGAVPPHILEKNFDHEAIKPDGVVIENKGQQTYWWPHGFSFWQEATPQQARYLTKYIQKNVGDPESQAMLVMSKGSRRSGTGPIGAAYFEGVARLYVEQGLSPQSYDYNFPDVLYEGGQRKGQRVSFRLRGKSAELFMQSYLRQWHELQGFVPMPYSQTVLDYLDPEGRVKRMQTKERIDKEKLANRMFLKTGKPRVKACEPKVYHDPQDDWDDGEPIVRKVRIEKPRISPRDMSDWQIAWEKEHGKAGRRQGQVYEFWEQLLTEHLREQHAKQQ